MKRILFAIAALAVLAAGCMKEQQPETSSDPVNKPVIVVSVAQTKATISPVEGTDQGKCIWQNGDQLAVYYQNSDATAGEIVKFTYSENFEDGSAKFVAETAPADGYTPVRVAHPVSSVTETGFSLTTEFTYDASDPDRLPLYLRSENITVNDDGSLSSQLHHNASVLKFTLHDVPAYAAGLAFESVRYKDESGAFVEKGASVASTTTVKTVTRFPYKTGYTADPASSANDVTLYVAAAHSSYPSRVYLIDGDGDEVEGSAKTFNVADGTKWISADDFIEFNTPIDFKKSELRKGYIMIKGVKWAKGNLRYDADVTSEGFQAGWSLTPEQWDYIGYDVKSSTIDDKEYTYSEDEAAEMRITRSQSRFEHFNWGGIGKWAFTITDYLKASPVSEQKDISGKIYSDQGGTTEVTGDARFATEGDSAPALYGDLAFWASKGAYRMPNETDMTSIHNQATKMLGWYVVDGVKIWGYLFRNPELGYNRDTDATANGNKEFSAADLETGMFFPCGGRTAESNPDAVINQRTQIAYWSSNYRKQNNAGTKYYAAYYSNTPSLKMHTSWNSTNSAWSCAAGFMIRPVLVEAAAE
ncbi:MAG: hypothetical protein IJX11_02120 [Bacteroidales bacterium]|nr:hypothetical protein [Bacteroidales bacterium]